MRLAELCCSAHPARADHEKNLRQRKVEKPERFFERDALLFNIAFRAIEFADHAPNSRACPSLPHQKRGGGPPAYNDNSVVLLFRSDGRRCLVAEFAVTDFPARVCDVAAGGHGGRSEQYHREREWHGRFRPAQRNDDGYRTECCDRIKQVNQFLSAIPVFVEPGMTIIISYGQDTIIPFFAEFIDRPRGNRGDEYENQRDNVRSTTF